MAEFNQPRDQQQEQPPKRRRNPSYVIAVALIGILVVLTLANLDAILRPIKALNSILAPVTIGVVLAYIANPFLRFFEHKLSHSMKSRRACRALAMLFSYVILLAILGGIVWLILPNVMDSIRDLQSNGLIYISNLIDSVNNLIRSLPFQLPGVEPGANFLSLDKLFTFVVDFLAESGTQLIGNIGTIAGGVLTVLKNILVGIFISIYILLSKDYLNAGCRRILRALLKPKSEKLVLRYVRTAHNKFGGFIVGKMADSLMVGLLCGILFTIFKIPYPVLIAVIIGVTDFIPFFGPFIGAIPSALIIFIIDPMKAILFALLILVVQQIDGNLIAPLILGNRTGLSSLWVIIAITVMGGLFGFAGMLIGVPLFALIMTILDDAIKSRLKKKDQPTGLYEYYPADAFIKPTDEERDAETLTMKFVRWVRSVETEEPDEDGKKHTFSRGLRHGFLWIGRFIYRIFSIKPIPEDQQTSLSREMVRHGMKTNRRFWRAVLFTVCTLGIYPIYMIEVIAQSANVACKDDGKRTWGWFPFLFSSIFTLGVYAIVWHCQVIHRMRDYCEVHGEQCVITRRYYLLWTLLGFPILVGPLLALARFLKAVAQCSRIYNENRTATAPAASESTAEKN